MRISDVEQAELSLLANSGLSIFRKGSRQRTFTPLDFIVNNLIFKIFENLIPRSKIKTHVIY